MKISFDFEGVLEKKDIQRMAQKFVDDGHEVWVCSARMDNKYGLPEWNHDIFEITSKLNIPDKQVILTNGTRKYRYLETFDIHFDDCAEEIELINSILSNCVGILISSQQ
jgi:hypothetical protein